MMIANILSSVRIDQLEVAKWVSVALYVLCTGGVVLGVYWEGHKLSKERQELGWKLLIGSLGAEMLLGISIFAADGWISQIQKGEIALLERQARGREISHEQARLVIDALRGRKVPEFTVRAVPDIEVGRFALSIWSLLRTAGVKNTTEVS